MMEDMIHRLTRGPATWEQLMEAAGATNRGRRIVAKGFLRQLVRTGLVIAPDKTDQPYKLAPIDRT